MGAGLYLVATKLDICHEINKELTKYFFRYSISDIFEL